MLQCLWCRACKRAALAAGRRDAAKGREKRRSSDAISRGSRRAEVRRWAAATRAPKCTKARRQTTTTVTASCLSSTGGWPIQPVRVYVGLK